MNENNTDGDRVSCESHPDPVPTARVNHGALQPSRRTPVALAATLTCLGILFASCGGGGEAAQNRELPAAAALAEAAATIAAATSVLWSNTPGGVGIVADGGDNVYTATSSEAVGADIALTRRDAAGNVQWTRG